MVNGADLAPGSIERLGASGCCRIMGSETGVHSETVSWQRLGFVESDRRRSCEMVLG